MYDGDSQGRWLEPLDDLVDLVRVDAKAGKCMRLGQFAMRFGTKIKGMAPSTDRLA